MTYEEKRNIIDKLFNDYTAIKDEDINALAEVYPLTTQAIYNIQKAAPEARIEVIAVTIPKELLDGIDNNVTAAFNHGVADSRLMLSPNFHKATARYADHFRTAFMTFAPRVEKVSDELKLVLG